MTRIYLKKKMFNNFFKTRLVLSIVFYLLDYNNHKHFLEEEKLRRKKQATFQHSFFEATTTETKAAVFSYPKIVKKKNK